MIKFGSVCSGIEAASVAWNPLGWAASWLAEIEPFPAAVLKHHYPETPNLGDMTKLPEMVLKGEIEAPDVLVGGTPCFTKGHLVLSETGYVPIEDCPDGHRYKALGNSMAVPVMRWIGKRIEQEITKGATA